MHLPIIALSTVLLGLSVSPAFARPAVPATNLASPVQTLVASRSGEDDAGDKASEARDRKAEPTRRLTTKQVRERAAAEQRRLLDEKATRARIQTNQRNLDDLRDAQAERLRLQQQTQRRMMYQQRQLALPQQPGQVPRLTPLDPPLMDQRNPRCGVPGMPLC